MMTQDEKERRLNSVRNLKRAVFAKWMDDTWFKLYAYNALLEPPTTIREANRARADRLSAENSQARELTLRLEKIEEKLCAMPSKGKITYFDGRESEIIYAGMLPNFKQTSEDEAQALKMLADYYAEETA